MVKIVATPTVRIALLAGIVFWIAVSLIPFPRPDPLPANAPAQDFSAARALDQVREIAQRPHPAGSPEQRRVRDYLLAELTKLGTAPQVEPGFAEITLEPTMPKAM